MTFIQLQGTYHKPIGMLIEQARKIVSDVCFGVDEMHLLGSKALVIRAEIFPIKLLDLCQKLQEIDVTVLPSSVPDLQALTQDIEYPFTLQITSYHTNTDNPIDIPKVPG